MKNDLGNRMKKYEECFKHFLPTKSCVILRNGKPINE